jgi:Tfp pilus assembly protein FimT
LELLLVLALMVAAAAVALPSLRNSFSDQRLQKAAEQIRAEWTRARIRAIKTGQTQVFRHTLYSHNYVTTPVASWEDDLEASAWVYYSPLGSGGTASGQPSGQNPLLQNSLRQSPLGSAASSRSPAINRPAQLSNPSLRRGRELPKDVVFLGADVQLDQRTLSQLSTLPADATLEIAALADQDAQSMAETTAGTPVFFYPDGTTSTVRLVLANEKQRVVEVWLRGLTGTVRVGPIQALSPYASLEASLQ